MLFLKYNTHVLLYFFHNGKLLVYWGRQIIDKEKREVSDGFIHINMNYFLSNALELSLWREQSTERRVEGFQKQIMMTSSFSLGHWSQQVSPKTKLLCGEYEWGQIAPQILAKCLASCTHSIADKVIENRENNQWDTVVTDVS